MLTEGLWRSDLRRRAAGVEDGRRRRRSSVTGMTQRCSGLLGSMGPLVAKLRSEPGGQDVLNFAGGEQLLEGSLTCSGGARVDSSEVVVVAEGSGLGKLPEPEVELLHGLAGAPL